MPESTDAYGWRWMTRLGVILLGFSLAGASTGPSRAAENIDVETHTVVIENMRFSPEQLTVKRGDRIVWVNKDLFPHTVTADVKAFDSGSIAATLSWTYVAGTAGDYAYACAFHPTMKGRIAVQ